MFLNFVGNNQRQRVAKLELMSNLSIFVISVKEFLGSLISQLDFSSFTCFIWTNQFDYRQYHHFEGIGIHFWNLIHHGCRFMWYIVSWLYKSTYFSPSLKWPYFGHMDTLGHMDTFGHTDFYTWQVAMPVLDNQSKKSRKGPL